MAAAATARRQRRQRAEAASGGSGGSSRNNGSSNGSSSTMTRSSIRIKSSIRASISLSSTRKGYGSGVWIKGMDHAVSWGMDQGMDRGVWIVCGSGALIHTLYFDSYPVCMYVCMHACMHVCMYVCVHVYIYILYIFIRTNPDHQSSSTHVWVDSAQNLHDFNWHKALQTRILIRHYKTLN